MLKPSNRSSNGNTQLHHCLFLHPTPVWVISPSPQYIGGKDDQIQLDLLLFTLDLPAYTSPCQTHANMRARGTANSSLTAPAKSSQGNISKFMDEEEA